MQLNGAEDSDIPGEEVISLMPALVAIYTKNWAHVDLSHLASTDEHLFRVRIIHSYRGYGHADEELRLCVKESLTGSDERVVKFTVLDERRDIRYEETYIPPRTTPML